MKKNVLIILMVYTSLVSFGQNILLDKMYGDSLRILTTSEVICRNFTDRMVLSVSLSKSMLNDGDSFYMIHLNVNQMSSCYIPENGRVLFKLDNDSILEYYHN